MKIMNSSFKKINFSHDKDTHYVSNTDYSADLIGGLFYLSKGDQRIKCIGGFSSLECAENFLSSHDIVASDDEHISYSSDDFEFITDVFGFEFKNGLWIAENDGITFILTPQDETVTLTIQRGVDSEVKVFDDLSKLIVELEAYFDDSGEGLFASTSHYTTLTIVYGASKSSRDVAKHLVRVKSSNIWSYGINIKDAKSGVGDVVIQFKGKNGGPDDVYIYYDVPVKLWRKFIGAPSKGHFFWANIRNNFWYSKLTGNKRGVLRNAINR